MEIREAGRAQGRGFALRFGGLKTGEDGLTAGKRGVDKPAKVQVLKLLAGCATGKLKWEEEYDIK